MKGIVVKTREDYIEVVGGEEAAIRNRELSHSKLMMEYADIANEDESVSLCIFDDDNDYEYQQDRVEEYSFDRVLADVEAMA